ncbi:hypothetical protein E2C01_084037 [Portunus trituberculatus]|uniref:Uncharacterized protein n=1 Tax=Portunus trituberculatus TaxID=210409 RepID=A0A5B7J2Y3_PORTR|nr:hypothetical protein [Portunus trituberculatus]
MEVFMSVLTLTRRRSGALLDTTEKRQSLKDRLRWDPSDRRGRQLSPLCGAGSPILPRPHSDLSLWDGGGKGTGRDA